MRLWVDCLRVLGTQAPVIAFPWALPGQIHTGSPALSSVLSLPVLFHHTQDTQQGVGMSSPNSDNPIIFKAPHTFPLEAPRLLGLLCVLRELLLSSPRVSLCLSASHCSHWGGCSVLKSFRDALGDPCGLIPEAHISIGSLALGDTHSANPAGAPALPAILASLQAPLTLHPQVPCCQRRL